MLNGELGANDVLAVRRPGSYPSRQLSRARPPGRQGPGPGLLKALAAIILTSPYMSLSRQTRQKGDLAQVLDEEQLEPTSVPRLERSLGGSSQSPGLAHALDGQSNVLFLFYHEGSIVTIMYLAV